MTFYCTTEQVWGPSFCLKFCRSYAPFETYNTGNTQYSTLSLFSYMIGHIELKFCLWTCLTVLQITFECCQFATILIEVMPLLELRILEIHSNPHFSLTCFDILSWNFTYDFVLLYYRSGRPFASILVGVMPLLELRILEIRSFSALFSYMLWHIELKFCIWLFTVLQNKFEGRHFASSFVGVMPLLKPRILQIHSILH